MSVNVGKGGLQWEDMKRTAQGGGPFALTTRDVLDKVVGYGQKLL